MTTKGEIENTFRNTGILLSKEGGIGVYCFDDECAIPEANILESSFIIKLVIPL
jgi:hypothetical protein